MQTISETTYRDVKHGKHGDTITIAHIHDSHHDGFRIIMQISHLVRQWANIEMVPIFLKIGLPKWSSLCTNITFGSQVME